MDEHLRELERAAQGGDPEARARWLRERVRLADLTEEQTLLAFLLGDPGAAAIYGNEPEPSPREWVLALSKLGKPVLVRVAVAAARAALPILEAEWPGERLPRQAVEAAQAWIDDPSEEHENDALSIASRVNMLREGLLGSETAEFGRGYEAINACFYAAMTAHARPYGELRFMHMVHVLPRDACREAVLGASAVIGEPAVRAAVAAEVLPWALRSTGSAQAGPDALP